MAVADFWAARALTGSRPEACRIDKTYELRLATLWGCYFCSGQRADGLYDVMILCLRNSTGSVGSAAKAVIKMDFNLSSFISNCLAKWHAQAYTVKFVP